MVTITTNTSIKSGPHGAIPKGTQVEVPEEYADLLQNAWLLAARSDDTNYKDPSGLKEADGIVQATSNWHRMTARNAAPGAATVQPTATAAQPAQPVQPNPKVGV